MNPGKKSSVLLSGYSDRSRIAHNASIKPILKTAPGITLYIIRDNTIVIKGDKPTSGTTTIAFPYLSA